MVWGNSVGTKKSTQRRRNIEIYFVPDMTKTSINHPRYHLKGTILQGIEYIATDTPWGIIQGWSDSDFGGQAGSRKSSTGFISKISGYVIEVLKNVNELKIALILLSTKYDL